MTTSSRSSNAALLMWIVPLVFAFGLGVSAHITGRSPSMVSTFLAVAAAVIATAGAAFDGATALARPRVAVTALTVLVPALEVKLLSPYVGPFTPIVGFIMFAATLGAFVLGRFDAPGSAVSDDPRAASARSGHSARTVHAKNGVLLRRHASRIHI